MFWQRVASLVKFYTNQFFLFFAERGKAQVRLWRYSVNQDLQAVVFPVKLRKIIDDNRRTVHCFRSFIYPVYSLPTQQGSVLPVRGR